MFEDLLDPATCGDLTPEAMIDAITALHQTEATLVARKWAVIARLLAHSKEQAADEEKTWAYDAWAAVRDQIAPAMRLSPRRASGQMRLAEGLTRYPHIAALLETGTINARVAETIIYRTELLNPSVQATVDAEIAARAGGYTALSEEALELALDALIEEHDPDAVRRYREAVKNCEVGFGKRDDATGTSSLYGRISAADAELGTRVLTALAGTVCAHDPRSKGELRAAAQGAVYRRQDRLVCQCKSPQCAAAGSVSTVPSAVIHVLAEQAALDTALAQVEALRQSHSGDPTGPPPTVDFDTLTREADAAEAARTPTPPEPPPWENHPEPEPEPEIATLSREPDWSHWFTTTPPPDDENGDGEPPWAHPTPTTSPADEDGGEDDDEPPGGSGGSPPPPPQPTTPDTGSGATTAAPDADVGEAKEAASERDSHQEHHNAQREAPAAYTPPRRPRPAVTLGGAIIPLDQLADLLRNGAAVTALPIPSGEPATGYRFIGKLREFIQCRDMRCRFPGCNRKAEYADIDHTLPHGDHGATHPSNGKALCREHHLAKTFRDWRDQQLPNGDVHWTAPTGHHYVTQPTTKTLFPDWDPTTATLPLPQQKRRHHTNQGITMPTRKRTREQDREQRIKAEREHNAMQRALGKPRTRTQARLATLSGPVASPRSKKPTES
jgi:hypothetical protein